MFVQGCFSVLQQGLPALGPVLLATFDLSLTQLGFLLASVSWGVVLTIYIWGTLVDSHGERLVVATGLGAAAAALLAASMQNAPLELGLALLVAGAAGSAAVVSSGRAVTREFAGAELGFAMGMRQVAIPAGAALSAAIVPLIVWEFGVRGIFVTFAGMSAVGACIGAICFSAGPVRRSGARPPEQPPPYTDRRILLLSCASGLMQWTQVSLNSFIAVMLVETQRLGVGTATGVFAAIHLSSAGMRILLGWWSDRSRTSLRDLARCAGVLTCSILLAAAVSNMQGLVVTVILALATLLSLSWNGLAVTALVELVGSSRVGSALGLHATMMRLCTLPTALLFGWTAATVGWTTGLLLLAVFPAVGGAMLLQLGRVRPAMERSDERS